MNVTDTLRVICGHYAEAMEDGEHPHDATAFAMMVTWVLMHPTTITEELDVTDEIAQGIAPIQLEDGSHAIYVTIKVKPSVVFEYLEGEDEAAQSFIEMCGPENAEAVANDDYIVIEEFVSSDLKGKGVLSEADRDLIHHVVGIVRESRTQIHGEAQIRSTIGGKSTSRTVPGREQIEQMLSDLDDGPKIVSDWARQLEEGGT